MEPKTPPHLAAVLTRLLKRSYNSERALAAALELSHSNLRQVLAGQRCSLKILARLLAIFPAPDDYWLILCAHLLDEAAAAGVDTQKLVVRPTDGITLREARISVVFEDYLGVIARRLSEEAQRPEKERLISQEVEWLSRVVVELTSRDADASVYRLAEEKSVAAAEDAAPVAEPSASLDGVLVSAAEALEMDKNQRRRVLSQFSDKNDVLRRPGASVNVSGDKAAYVAGLTSATGNPKKS